MEDVCDAAAIIEAVKKGAETELLEIGKGIMVASVPGETGRRLASLKAFEDERRTHPERREGTAQMDDLESFCEHANRFKCSSSALFAYEAGPSLMAVLDYHQGGEGGEARFGRHRTNYRFPVADEWTAWTGVSGSVMSQRTFAEFLEEHITDVADPGLIGEGSKATLAAIGGHAADASQLMTLARGLSINVNRKVKQHQNLATGEIQVQFEEEHKEAGGDVLKVPNAFLLAIPVFRNGDRFQVVARLRYRVKDGDIQWTIMLHRTDRVLTHAFREATDQARAKTELPLFYGLPE